MRHRPLTPAEKREIEESIDALRAAMRRATKPTARERAFARAWLVVYDGGKEGA